MAALTYNLKIQQGATFRKVFRWRDAAGELKKIGTWTAHAQIKAAYGDASAVLDLSTETGEIVLIDGYITILLTKEQTRRLAVSYTKGRTETYYYDLFVYDTDGNGRKLFMGTIIVEGAVTNAT